jgi:hypothetical protein
MHFKIAGNNHDDAKNNIVKLRCPSCRQKGTFDAITIHDVSLHIPELQSWVALGQRRCPDPECRAHVFVALKKSTGQVIVSYPTERIDFDATDIPSAILNAFEEAVTCHANRCYVASAIMVRKTLEEICRERGATGANLKQRVATLKGKVVLPTELLNGLDDLRLLGNDAAHIESQEYDKIGQEEVEIGIEITKEVLKAVYQYSSLIGRLQKLRKSPTP